MKIVINGITVQMNNNDVKVAKRLVREFLATSREKAEERGSSTFFYTLLIVMHIMANDYIQSLTPEVMALILNAQAMNKMSRQNMPYTPLIQKKDIGRPSKN